MTATIIQFPTGQRITEQPDTVPDDEDAFLAWFEQNVIPLANGVAELERLANDPDRTDFWAYARAVRDTLTSWPIPDKNA